MRSDNHYHGSDGVARSITASQKISITFMKHRAFLGRICPEKRVDRAIEIAKRSGRKLKIAAKVDPADREYFSDYIQPLLHHPSGAGSGPRAGRSWTGPGSESTPATPDTRSRPLTAGPAQGCAPAVATPDSFPRERRWVLQG